MLGNWLSVAKSAPWSEVKEFVELLLWGLTLLAVFFSLARLKMIGGIIKDFKDSRGSLWDLKVTVDKLGGLEPTIKSLVDQTALIGDKVDAAGKQVAALQVETISNRTSEDVADSDAASPATFPEPVDEGIDHNWEMLREYWRRNTQRLEYVIENIHDGRTQLAYNRLPRTNYSRIIHKMQGQKLISAAAANASKQLNDLFNSYRPRNRRVPESVAESLVVLDQQLDEAIVPIAIVLAAEATDDSAPILAENGSNGSGEVTRRLPRNGNGIQMPAT